MIGIIKKKNYTQKKKLYAMQLYQRYGVLVIIIIIIIIKKDMGSFICFFSWIELRDYGRTRSSMICVPKPQNFSILGQLMIDLYF